MAETRTYDPTEPEGIQKLVREALGESIRPVEPGAPQFPASADERVATTLSAKAGNARKLRKIRHITAPAWWPTASGRRR